MAEEFANFILSIKEKPINDKLNIFIDVVERMVSMIIKLTEIIDDKFVLLDNQLMLLENPINQIQVDINDIEEAEDSKYVPEPYVKRDFERPLGSESTKNTIIGELKSLFEKRKKMGE